MALAKWLGREPVRVHPAHRRGARASDVPSLGHPRAKVLAAAAEAAARQGRFWEMHDSLLEDQGHLDDPHLWERAERFGLDLDRFEADRRDALTVERIEADFRSGIRAGVATTPTQFVAGEPFPGVPDASLLAVLR